MFSDGGPRGRVDEDEGKPPGRLCGAKPSDIMKLESPGVAIVALESFNQSWPRAASARMRMRGDAQLKQCRLGAKDCRSQIWRSSGLHLVGGSNARGPRLGDPV